MSANDDDLGGDDDQLKRLRSVWVSMRSGDEEPSERGLDALMAAARTKAADMAPPASEGLWAKLLSIFRRPPVLALASLTVLLGGALFITQRHDRIQSEAAIAARPEQSAPGAAPTPDLTREDALPTESAGAAGSSAQIQAPTAIPGAPPRDPDPRSHITTGARPREPRREETKRSEKPRAEKADEDVPLGKPTSIVVETEVAGGAVQAVPDGVNSTPQNGTRAPVAKPPSATPSNDSFGRTDPKLEMDGANTASTNDRRSQVAQLVKQCESAAARNDCAAVRVLAKRIQSADVDAYSERVAKNTAIARCLE